MKANIRPSDFHTHSLEHGRDKPLRVEEMAQVAIIKGIVRLCFTDHFPLPPGFIDPVPEQDCAMPAPRYEEYQKLVGNTTERNRGRIQILRGAEVDFLPDFEEWTRLQLPRYGFDYIIGSVHFVGNKEDPNLILDYDESGFVRCLNNYGGIEELSGNYYERMRQMAQSDMFDGVGHLDLIKKYNKDTKYFTGEEKWYRDEVLKTLDVIAKTDMAIELNTSGWDKNCDEQYPSEWILREAYTRNIPLTVGSDAHIPDNVGRNFERALDLSKKVGYSSIAYFVKQKKMEVSI